MRVGKIALLSALALFWSGSVSAQVFGRHPVYPGGQQPSGQPTDEPSPGHYRPLPRVSEQFLPPPFDLASTTDQNVCTQHGGFGGGLACKAQLPEGDLALVWDWQGRMRIDGYRIYRVEANSRSGHIDPRAPVFNGGGPPSTDVQTWNRTLIGTQSNGAAATLYIADNAASLNVAGECFAATAYSGAQESQLSAPFCATSASNEHTLNFPPAHILEFYVSYYKYDGFGTVLKDPIAMRVGYVTSVPCTSQESDDENKGIATSCGGGQYASEFLYFALPATMTKTIDSATLTFHVDSAQVGTTPSASLPDSSTSCITDVGIALNHWWTTNDYSHVQRNLANPDQQAGPEVSYDVTSIVQGWEGGQENDGFYLAGKFDGGDPDGTSCITTYRPENIQLVVRYH